MDRYICLQPLYKTPGPGVELETLERLCVDLLDVFGFDCSIAHRLEMPDDAYLSIRDQYLASEVLVYVKSHNHRGAHRVLAVTDRDLCAEGLNFVFGQAELGGRFAIISTHRLRGSTTVGDGRLYYLRVLKEAIHELGHTFGLVHCDDMLCIMYSSNTLEDTDLKGPDFCHDCRLKLDRYLQMLIYR